MEERRDPDEGDGGGGPHVHRASLGVLLNEAARGLTGDRIRSGMIASKENQGGARQW